MSAGSVAVIDLLNALLAAEQNSIFRFMDEGSPYLSHATAEIRRPLHEMVRAGERRIERLSDAIEQLGGVAAPRGIQNEEQYLAFLSMKFLLPKLVEAKKLAVDRYENALRTLSAPATGTPGTEIIALLQHLLAEHGDDLKLLEKAVADIDGTERPA